MAVRVKFTTVPITVASTVATTALQLIAATNHRANLKKLIVSFSGITPADAGIRVDIVRQTDAGTTTGALAGVKVNTGDPETIQTTATYKSTSDPTDSDLLESFYLNQQDGDRQVFPIGMDIPIPGSTRLGIKLTPGTLTASIKAVVHAEVDE